MNEPNYFLWTCAAIGVGAIFYGIWHLLENMDGGGHE